MRKLPEVCDLALEKLPQAIFNLKKAIPVLT